MRAALAKLDGAASAEVDFAAKTATVTMAPGKTLTREDCTKALAGTKYTISSFEAAAN
ncbi:MAG: heavy-metal-associated domain-containing protein [Deltaproteobacteria bacterium]|nr:heavy-metal-associated domain-containing protein [Deltaproteobacteria bacterium]